MKATNRLKNALIQATEQLLNQQVSMEGRSSAQYLAMASWCDTRGYKGGASFLYQHAEEEREHMLKLMHYINDSGGHALCPGVSDLQHEFGTLRQVFEMTLVHEVEVTRAIHHLLDHCLTVKDFATFNFLQWFVAEQTEEEAWSRRAVELFDIIGEDGIGCYTIDQAIGALRGGKIQ